MTIILLDSDRLKICLDKAEAAAHGLDEGYARRPIHEIRKTLASLLKKAYSEAGFNPGHAKLFVEIWPDESSGCILCFTAIHGLRLFPGGGEIEPVVYAFESALMLVRAICDLHAHYAHRIYNSSLYAGGMGYILILRILDYNERRSMRFLEEYAPIAGCGEVLAAYIDEHYKPLLRDNAVDRIGRKLALGNQNPD